ncbi:MAG TPA: hypothetical protein VH120_09280 [Gemmataceae bacterium]|jgi:hypothetical protein|nr:hypothetical protein [Gemmataceae bacterium]
MNRTLGSAVIAFAVVSGNAPAADLTIKNVHVGQVLHGPPVADDQLEGAVVFVEEWGIH